MWVFWALIVFMAIAWSGYSWVATLVTKFEHTLESRIVLLLLGGAGLLTGWRITLTLAPGWSTMPVLTVSSGIGFAVFCLYSYIMANFWVSVLTRDMDERIAQMEEEEDVLVRRLEAHRWSSLHGRTVQDPDEEEQEETARERELSSLRSFVDAWEKGGGAARVRSLKVLEWREEISGMTSSQVTSQIRESELELPREDDPVRAEQLQVRIALLKMERLERQDPSGGRVQRRTTPAELIDPSSMRSRLQELHREVQSEKAQKAEFLRSRVRLSWRGKQ